MGRLRSALEALYQNDAAAPAVQPEVHVIRPAAREAAAESQPTVHAADSDNTQQDELDAGADAPVASDVEHVRIEDLSKIEVVSEPPDLEYEDGEGLDADDEDVVFEHTECSPAEPEDATPSDESINVEALDGDEPELELAELAFATEEPGNHAADSEHAELDHADETTAYAHTESDLAEREESEDVTPDNATHSDESMNVEALDDDEPELELVFEPPAAEEPGNHAADSDHAELDHADSETTAYAHTESDLAEREEPVDATPDNATSSDESLNVEALDDDEPELELVFEPPAAEEPGTHAADSDDIEYDELPSETLEYEPGFSAEAQVEVEQLAEDEQIADGVAVEQPDVALELPDEAPELSSPSSPDDQPLSEALPNDSQPDEGRVAESLVQDDEATLEDPVDNAPASDEHLSGALVDSDATEQPDNNQTPTAFTDSIAEHDEQVNHVMQLVEQVLGVAASDAEALEEASPDAQDTALDTPATTDTFAEDTPASTCDGPTPPPPHDSFDSNEEIPDADNTHADDSPSEDSLRIAVEAAHASEAGEEATSDALPTTSEPTQPASLLDSYEEDAAVNDGSSASQSWSSETQAEEIEAAAALGPAEFDAEVEEPEFNLLEQVLGISPTNIVESELDSLSRLEDAYEEDADLDATSSADEMEPDEQEVLSDELAASLTSKAGGERPFQPAMETWAEFPAPSDQETPPISADAEPPFANTPPLDQKEGRNHPTPGLQPPLLDPSSIALAESGSSTDMLQAALNHGSETLSDALDGNDAGTTLLPNALEPQGEDSDENDAASVTTPPPANAMETDAPEFVEADAPPAEATFVDANAPEPVRADAASVLASLAENVTPLAFERAMAARVIDSEFGTHIQELSQRVLQELPQSPAVLLIVGTEQDDQRSDIVTGLTMHICGQVEAGTLLVDADVEFGKISRNFEQLGLGLADSVRLESPWYDCVVATSCKNMRFLPCGVFDKEYVDAELQAGAQQVVEEWRATFGLVIIDAGTLDNPLLPFLAELADAVYLCVQLGVDERAELETATASLSAWNTHLKGCITTGPAAN